MIHFLFSLLLICFNLLAADDRVPVTGASLYCKTMGKGSPLLMIHGGPGLSHDYLLPQMEELAKDHFVIFYDQRGCGKSSGKIDTQTINLQTFTDDIEAIRVFYKLDKVSLFGHSWGGLLAMRYAIAHPEHVERVILSNSIASSSEDFQLFLKHYAEKVAPIKGKIDAYTSSKEYLRGDPKVVECYRHFLFSMYCYVPKHADALSLQTTRKAAVDGMRVMALFRENLLTKPFSLTEELKKMDIPTLVIHGDVDMVPVETAKHTASAIPHAGLVIMEHCGHFPYVEDPTTYFKHLRKFLN